MTTPGDLPVRPEVLAAHRTVAQRWVEPGAAWSSLQRRAIVEQVRAARADERNLAPWQSPSADDGQASAGGLLSAAAIDAVWRITNHPATLSRSWFDEVRAAGVTDAQYVEMLSLVSQVCAVDSFATSLGHPLIELAEPADVDEPATGDVAADAEVTTHWVPTTGDGANIQLALSLVPRENEAQMALVDAQYVPGGALGRDLGEAVWSLERTQIELIGARTSALNECFY